MKRPQIIAVPIGKVFEAADGLSLFNPLGVEKMTDGLIKVLNRWHHTAFRSFLARLSFFLTQNQYNL